MRRLFRSKAAMGMVTDMVMGGAIAAAAAITTVGTAATTTVGIAATTMAGGIIAIGGDFTSGLEKGPRSSSGLFFAQCFVCSMLERFASRLR